jgi:hypothetical protein
MLMDIPPSHVDYYGIIVGYDSKDQVYLYTGKELEWLLIIDNVVYSISIIHVHLGGILLETCLSF